MRFPKLIAFVAGLASATAFAPLDWWPLMPLAFAVLLLLLADARTGWRAAAVGWWFALGQSVLGLNWIATAFTFQAAMPAWLGWVAVLLLSLYLAVYPLLATLLAWWGARLLAPLAGGGPLDRDERFRERGLVLTLLLAACWIGCEWLRATCFTGFAWNPVGVIWLDLPGIARAARLIGTYGLSGVVVLAGGALAALLAGPRTVGLGWLGALALAAIACMPPAPPPAAGPLLRIVQPDIGQETHWDAHAEATNRARLMALSGRPEGRPRLLLWPEAAVTVPLEEYAGTRAQLAGLLGPRDMMLTGGVAFVYPHANDWRVGAEPMAARNSVFALDPAGTLRARYDKAHLVPYGEYLPMRPLLSAIGLSRLAPGDLDFLPGPGPRTLDVPGFGAIGFQLCYEIIFSGHVVDAAHRPRFVFNPSNDAWFGRWGPPQHLAQARLRAIEEGMPIVRATPTGISAIVDARGRVVAALPWRRPGAIEAPAPGALPPPPFARFGNLLSALFAILLAALAIASALLPRYRHITKPLYPAAPAISPEG